MCKKLTVAYGDYIGSRMVGWCVFNGKDYSFISDKTVKAKIKAGDLANGLMVDAEDNVAINQEFTKSLMGKSGLSFNPITAAGDEDDEPVMNKYYALVKVVKAKDGTKYHFITNRCGYEIFSEEQLKAMLAVLDMGGIKLGADWYMGLLMWRMPQRARTRPRGSPRGRGRSEMTASFVAGFTCCSMVVFLYLLYELLQVARELVSILRESLEELRED